MRFLRILGLIGGLMPAAYCVQLIFSVSDVMEFLDPGGTGGWWERASRSGLVPAIIGLGAVGLVFVIAFVLKLIGVIRSHPSEGVRSRRMPEEPTITGGDAEAAAMITRYLAKQAREAPSSAPARPLPSAKAGSFGRRAG